MEEFQKMVLFLPFFYQEDFQTLRKSKLSFKLLMH